MKNPASGGVDLENRLATDFSGQYTPAPTKDQYAALSQSLLNQGFLGVLFPSTRTSGSHIRIGNVQGDPGSSMVVCIATGAWYDHATGEHGGDLCSLYAARHNLRMSEAYYELLRGHLRESSASPPTLTTTTTEPNPFPLKIWNRSFNIIGSIGEQYLRSRDIWIDPGAEIRFNQACPRDSQAAPAMVGLVRDIFTNEPIAVHRTFLKHDGSGKASLEPNKMMLGAVKDGAVKISPLLSSDDELAIAEGIENALTILQSGVCPVWSLLSANGIRAFPVLPQIKKLTIFADHDPVGLAAAKTCAETWKGAGRHVKVSIPFQKNTDWNDTIRGTLK